MSARDVIAAFLEVRDENVTPDDCDDQERADSAAAIVEALTAAGYRILGPDELDPVTVERCAKVAETGYWSSALGEAVGPAVAVAIRSLIPAQPEAKEAPHD